MKRNLLFVSLLAVSGASLIAVDTNSVRKVVNSRGQSFLVGSKAQGPRIKVANQNQAALNGESKDLSGASTQQKNSEAPAATGWLDRAKSWFTFGGEHISEAYAKAKEKAASVKGTAQEQLANTYTSAKEKFVEAKEIAHVAKEATQAELLEVYTFGQENKTTAAAVAAAGFTTGVALKYLWDKANTGARVAGAIGLSFAGVMLSDNAQAQTFVQENSAPLAIAAVAASAGVLSRTAYSYFSRKTKVKEVKTPYSLYWTDKGSNSEKKKKPFGGVGVIFEDKVESSIPSPKPIVVELG